MPYREQIPVDKGLDNTISFLLEGYLYISNRTKRYHRNMFATRLLGGKQVVCMLGEEAAKVFYDEERFKRQGAAPKRLLQTLFGEDGVQTLDNDTHRLRKGLFMSLMTAERLQDIAAIVKAQWNVSLKKWGNMNKIELYDEAKEIMTWSACSWAGVPLTDSVLNDMTAWLSSMFEAGGVVGPRHWRGKVGRNQAEQWVERLITDVRNGQLEVAEGKALSKIALYLDRNGDLLEPKIAAVELINILRPIVAISVYVAFCALALYEHPQAKEQLVNGTDDDYRMFVQEVRRYYPFFPTAIAKARKDFLWNGHDFRKGTLVLLDLYGTNHDANHWKRPHEFKPERFKNRKGTPFDFIPQGGGDYYKNHRCPGEWLTINVMQACLDMLVNQMDYHVPKQNLRFSMTRFPSLPKSRFIMMEVRAK
ncbi:cytochrome P450 [Lentibacillus sp. N15]|uniref:cytochrome P450 n=1 Tax=Lentibacillus songyuanensis TaxID=3136161 RepID=UPI0031BA700C